MPSCATKRRPSPSSAAHRTTANRRSSTAAPPRAARPSRHPSSADPEGRRVPDAPEVSVAASASAAATASSTAASSAASAAPPASPRPASPSSATGSSGCDRFRRCAPAFRASARGRVLRCRRERGFVGRSRSPRSRSASSRLRARLRAAPPAATSLAHGIGRNRRRRRFCDLGLGLRRLGRHGGHARRVLRLGLFGLRAPARGCSSSASGATDLAPRSPRARHRGDVGHIGVAAPSRGSGSGAGRRRALRLRRRAGRLHRVGLRRPRAGPAAVRPTGGLGAADCHRVELGARHQRHRRSRPPRAHRRALEEPPTSTHRIRPA